jgi:hypothetical protein
VFQGIVFRSAAKGRMAGVLGEARVGTYAGTDNESAMTASIKVGIRFNLR